VPPGMKQRTVQTLYAYWNELRAGRIAPRRLEIEPSRISSILAETFMLERTDASTYRYRLAGTRLYEIFGAELRGTNLLDGWSKADRASVMHSLAATCEQGAVTLLDLEAGADAARRIRIEAILLPLMHADNTIGRVIGAMAVTNSPHWLGHERLVEKRLVGHDLLPGGGAEVASGYAPTTPLSHPRRWPRQVNACTPQRTGPAVAAQNSFSKLATSGPKRVH
jgi:hypothetical protein